MLPRYSIIFPSGPTETACLWSQCYPDMACIPLRAHRDSMPLVSMLPRYHMYSPLGPQRQHASGLNVIQISHVFPSGPTETACLWSQYYLDMACIPLWEYRDSMPLVSMLPIYMIYDMDRDSMTLVCPDMTCIPLRAHRDSMLLVSMLPRYHMYSPQSPQRQHASGLNVTQISHVFPSEPTETACFWSMLPRYHMYSPQSPQRQHDYSLNVTHIHDI